MNWVDLPLKLKAYIATVALFAAPILAWAIWRVFTTDYDNGWVILTILAVFTVPFFLLIPSFNATITIGDSFVMAIAMLYGTAPCIVATFCYILPISILAPRPKTYVYRVIFNTANTTCCAMAYGSIYHLFNKGSADLQKIILPAVALVATYFLTNSLLTSIAIAWSQGGNVFKFWVRSCMPLAFDYSVTAVCAVVIVSLKSINEYVPIAVAPIIGIVWGWNKLNTIHMMEAEKHLKEQEQLYIRTVESLALAVDAKDQTTYGHIRRVRVYAMGLAKLCGIKDPNELKAIETGSLLHDIGKLAIDDYILNKPGRLSKQEFEKIKIHAAAGDEILQHVQFPFPAAKLVRYHHERWDGLGYPDGLKGEEIPLGARILAVADAFDAIRFSRPYKLAIPMEEALELLRAQSGTIYAPALIKLFVENVEELEKAAVLEASNLTEPSFRKYFESVNRSLSAADDSAPALLYSKDVPADLILLAEFCNTIKGHLDIEDVFPLFAGRMKRMLPFTTCAFYLKDSSDSLRAAYASGLFSEQVQRNILSIGKGISGWVAAYKRPMINAGPALDFVDPQGDLGSFSDALVVPIIYEDETLGTISLYARDAATYSQQELDILQAIASLLGPLISESAKFEIPSAEKILDPTTRLHRVSYLTTVSPQMIAFAEKNKAPVSLIYLEVRNLSQIIRIYGSNSANLVLKRIADCIKPELRATDILVRFGHQGFVAFLPGVRDEQAMHCAQRLKNQIKTLGSLVSGQSLALDCRTGIASYPRDGITIFALLQSAQKNTGASPDEIISQDHNVVEFQPRS